MNAAQPLRRPTAAVVCASPMLAPQVSKVLAPEAWLDVDAVIEAALDATRGRT